MKMKHALKKKNVLIGNINTEFYRLKKYNTVDIMNENTRPYQPEETLKKIRVLTDELVEMKTRIQKTNRPIHHKVFRLSELKNLVEKLKELSCDNGKVEDSYSYRGDKYVVSDISIQERDRIIEELSLEIDEIQDELDQWNQITELVD
ncbi:MAG: hypothetical protein ACK4YD_02025 [Chitinophagia bacterium]|jgi:hypothetical protein